MSVARDTLINALSPPLPHDVVEKLSDEYLELKRQFFLGHYAPSELDAGRFSECVLRIVQHQGTGTYTPLGESLRRTSSTDAIIRRAENNTALPDTIRFLIPRLTRVILDVRNKRDVAHVAAHISPNLADSQLLCQCADWILVELVRNYCGTSIEDARKLVRSINEVKIPIVAEVDGFVRVQASDLKTDKKVLVILYYRHPEQVSVKNLLTWTEYSNSTRFRKEILKSLHDTALIHYHGEQCSLLPKGERYVEEHISFDLLV